MVHVKKCPVKGKRGLPSTEFYIDGKPQIYCLGWQDAMTDEPLPECKECKDWANGEQCEKDFQNARKRNKPRMTTEQNIRAILECNFAGFKEEIIDNVTKRLCEMISDLGVLKWNDIKEKEPPYHTDILVVDIDGEIYLTHRTESSEYYDSCYGDRIKGIKWWLLLPRQNESEE